MIVALIVRGWHFMVFVLLAVLAEFEREQVSERTTMAMAHKRSRGERLGQNPYGFNLAADGVSLVENSAEQVALTMIRELEAAMSGNPNRYYFLTADDTYKLMDACNTAEWRLIIALA